MELYNITGKENFVIYGASFLGKQIYGSLRKNNLNVAAFLDKRVETAWSVYAEEHGFQADSGDRNIADVYDGVPIYHPDHAAGLGNDCVVIIAITNNYEHPIIADILYTMGYRKILCQFPGSGLGNKAAAINNKIYDIAVKGESLIGKEAAYYETMLLRESRLADIAEDAVEESCVMQIPVELLLYMDDDGVKKSVYVEDKILPYYNFLEGRGGKDFLELRDHIQDNGTDVNRWMELNAVKYFHLSLEWESEENKTENLPFVEKTERGSFLVKTHLDQVIFYVAKGYHRVRCRLTKSDLESWDKPAVIKRVLETIVRQRISSVYTPILYPAFYWFQYRRESSGHTRLMRMCRYFVEKGISVEGKNVLDAGAYVGYFAQHMYRMGANVTAVEFDKDNYELMTSINDLLGCDGINTLNIGIQDMEETKKFDVTILLTVLYWHFDTELGLQLMEKIDKVTSGILLWESGDEVEREKEWIFAHSSFDAYEKISDTFGTHKLREMGVFYRKK